MVDAESARPTVASLDPATPVVTGRGWHAPEDRLTNRDIAGRLDEGLLRAWVAQNRWCMERLEGKAELTRADLEGVFVSYVEERIGIRARHVVDRTAILEGRPSQSEVFASHLGAKACEKAIADAGVEANDIEQIICVTGSPDQVFPTTGNAIQGLIGAENANSYDLLAACSGFAYGLHTARGMVASGVHRRVLVVSAEYFTAMVNYADPNNSFFWGDAGAAVVIERADLSAERGGMALIGSHCISIPSRAIRTGLGGTIPYLAGASRHRGRADADVDLGAADDPYFYQDGRKVYRDVVPRVVAESAAFLERHGLSADDMKRFWFHQPSQLFLGAVVKRLLKEEIPSSRVAVSLDEYGNTSSCGAPLCLAQDDVLQPGEYGLVAVFGAGYTIGLSLLRGVAPGQG
jgi:beta-ketodecanoyl-[acyl-carrier-protein] synthase